MKSTILNTKIDIKNRSPKDKFDYEKQNTLEKIIDNSL